MANSGRTKARRIEVTEDASTLPGAGYSSTFAVDRPTTTSPGRVGGADRTAEQWLQDMFEGAPPAVRRFVLFGWRWVLHFRLASIPSASHIAGWVECSPAPDVVTLEVHSRSMTARKVLRITSSRVEVTTFVRFERPGAKLLWSAVAPIHHRTEPFVLAHAAVHPGNAAA